MLLGWCVDGPNRRREQKTAEDGMDLIFSKDNDNENNNERNVSHKKCALLSTLHVQ